MINHNSGYLRRLAASILDTFIWLNIFFVPLYFLLLTFEDTISAYDLLNTTLYVVVVILLSNLLGLIYQIYFLSKYGGTLGKLIFGIKVVDKDTQEYLDKRTAFYRSTIGYAFSAQFMGLGFWRMIKHPENFGWHDDLFNTRVILAKKTKLGLVALAAAVTLVAVVIMLIGSELARSELFDMLITLTSKQSTLN